jgi:hypothetical protein
VPTMAAAVILSAILFAVFWLLRGSGSIKSAGARAIGSFYAFYKSVFATLTPPLARAFWDELSSGTLVVADRTRKVYNGNGQIYSLYILYFFIALYVASSVLHHM